LQWSPRHFLYHKPSTILIIRKSADVVVLAFAEAKEWVNFVAVAAVVDSAAVVCVAV